MTVVGARPQFIKASVISGLVNTQYKHQFTETIVHSGQHYFENMSTDFLNELSIKSPILTLSIETDSHAKMTSDIMSQLEPILLDKAPHYILVYGDTNTTLAASLTAVKLNIPIIHVEAGLRSFNKKMPEEINRILTDHMSSLLFCPTKKSIENLAIENIKKNVFLTGDIMLDLIKNFNASSPPCSDYTANILNENTDYVLATCHRAENIDNDDNLLKILSLFDRLSHELPIILPLHPRAEKALKSLKHSISTYKNIIVTPPLGYFDMLHLQRRAKMIVTDSGGVQKEAYFLKTPCVTIRGETEWNETLLNGWNILLNINDHEEVLYDKMCSQLCFDAHTEQDHCFGDGRAGQKILECIIDLHE